MSWFISWFIDCFIDRFIDCFLDSLIYCISFKSRLALEVYRDLQLFAIKNSPPLLLSLLLFDQNSSSFMNGASGSAAASSSYAVIPYLRANAAANKRNSKNSIYLKILMDLGFSSKVMKEISNILRNNNSSATMNTSSNAFVDLNWEKVLLISE